MYIDPHPSNLHSLRTIKGDGLTATPATAKFHQDWPRFCWRGLQLDAVRHFMPVGFVMLGAAKTTATTKGWLF